MVNIIRGDLSKPIASQQLASFFEDHEELEGTLYLGYPIIGTAEGGYQVDALFLSRKHGVIVFQLVEGTQVDLDAVPEFQDESYTKLQAKLLQYKLLTKRRELGVKISVVTYAPAANISPYDDNSEYPVIKDSTDISRFISSRKWNDGDQYFEPLVSAIQGITTIRNKKQRSYIRKDDSRGAKLKRLEDSIANLDSTQSEAVISTVEGVQRIRGLAGSGKTIVLALKVAYLHAKHPDWKIAVTFNTRSLKDQFKKLINTFSIEHTNEEPDWEKIDIIHAWGSPKSPGIYYDFCIKHNVEYIDFTNAKRISKSGEELDLVCQKALREVGKSHYYYDAILIDEAQDFSHHFLRLCYEILLPPKRLVYAYDELQSLSKKLMEPAETIFGLNENGQPNVQLRNEIGEGKQDIILEKCYRNSKPVLTTAHALGFGIYRPEGLVQMFDSSQLWLDIGYRVDGGELKDGEFVKLSRKNEASPLLIDSHPLMDDLIQFKTLKNAQDQAVWLVNEIEKNLTEDELRYDDIMVIHTNPLKTLEAVGIARELLFKKGINCNLAGVTTSPDSFFSDDSVVFTSIYRAKGNEAAMIYIIDAHECFSGSELARKRNVLFTAITRSKAWVRVSGYGSNMVKLSEEFDRIKNANFSLDFPYPTQRERENMNIVNRDRSISQRKVLERKNKELDDIVDLLDRGEIRMDDFSPEKISRLRELLGQE
jgi:superfamily I DNA and RNA helicase